MRLTRGERALLEIVMATHAGMTTAEFEQIVKDWIATETHPRSKDLTPSAAKGPRGNWSSI